MTVYTTTDSMRQPEPNPEPRFRFATMFRALRYRNFRLFFVGQSISLIGTWMQQVAMSWLVYRLTLSPLLLGIVTFASQIPSFVFAPFAGVLADRHNRHRILLLTQVLAMMQAFTLAALTYLGLIDIYILTALSFVLGAVTALDIPTRQSFLIQMVEKKENLGNAISLNSLMFNSARLVGPAIAGIILSYTSEAGCFFLNGVSFFAVLVSLLLMDVAHEPSGKEHPAFWSHFSEGFRYTFTFLPIRAILLVLAFLNLFGASYMVLLPVFVREVLGGSSDMYGYLVASAGLGALTGTIVLASRKSVLGLGRLIAAASAVFGLALIAFSFSKSFALSACILAFAGFWLMTCLASCNIILQTIVDDDKRGRVMSFYTLAFMGTMPIGSLLMGSLAQHLGVARGLIVAGAGCVLVSTVFATALPAVRAAIRPIYMRMGILPQVPPAPIG